MPLLHTEGEPQRRLDQRQDGSKHHQRTIETEGIPSNPQAVTDDTEKTWEAWWDLDQLVVPKKDLQRSRTGQARNNAADQGLVPGNEAFGNWTLDEQMDQALHLTTVAGRVNTDTKPDQAIGGWKHTMGDEPVGISDGTNKGPEVEVGPNAGPLDRHAPQTELRHATMILTSQT